MDRHLFDIVRGILDTRQNPVTLQLLYSKNKNIQKYTLK